MNRVAFVLAACLFPAAAGAQSLALSNEVSRAVSNAKLGAATVGISIRDVTSGQVLSDVRADQPMIPASNMKVLTSGAALLALSPAFQFRTELVQDGDRLVFKGSGDPALADPDLLARMNPRLTVSDVLGVLAGAAQKAGVVQATEIVVDDRVFDRQFVHPSWPTEKLDRGYSAEVAGVNFHANVLLAFPGPGRGGAGSLPTYSIQPDAPWIEVENRARTTSQGKNSVWLSREPFSNRFTLRGEVRQAAQVGVEITIHNPPEFVGQLLADHLSRAGVRIGDGTGGSTSRVASEGDVFEGGRVIAAVNTPIEEVLHRCNSDSANLYAEALLKRLGHEVTREPGSWSNGGAVLRMMISQHLGARAAGDVTIADGSGLSRDNAVAPATLTRWLGVLASNDAARDMFTASLARPGQGTLRRRFSGVRLQNELYAKSGFINGVRTLSGYVVDPSSGRRVAFSVMVNDIRTDTQTAGALNLHEDVVKIIDRYLVSLAPAASPR
ncbi:MAG: D-alanyl-D-alanine carboxypeptidase/D-alanyl-D-alanine-endopeptidase [Planctomycetota bacterium]|nr:D-alanyl-D-alanine carboxypeptidase/D-alanyl-D-alanine-endopeptidase [Planctomycetota bacterium]